jgi:predicted nucleotidyltransferase
MRLDRVLEEKCGEILRIAAEHGARGTGLRVRRTRGADRESDMDFLVELETGRSLMDLGGLQMELESLLGRRVDVVTARGLKARIRERVLREAVPVCGVLDMV